MKLIDILVERRQAKEKYFKDYLFWAKEVKKAAAALLGEARVFVFGSVLKQEEPGEAPGDIDVLVISPNAGSGEARMRKQTKILKQATGLDSPFELHLISPQDYEEWYKFFIKEKVEA